MSAAPTGGARPPQDARPRLLIRVPDWVGDLVAAEPVLRAADAAGGATLAGDPRLLALFDGVLPACARVAADDPAAWRGHGAALLLTGSFRSAWLAARAGIPVRAGQARDGRGALLTHGVAPARERGGVPLGLGVRGRGRRWLPRPFGTVCVELAALVGLAVRERTPRLHATEAARARARARLAPLGLAPGAQFLIANLGGRPGAAKTIPAATWARILGAVAERLRAPLVCVAGPGEEESLEAARAAGAPGIALGGPALPLDELVALLADARVLLTADSGPRHLAAAVGTAVVALCGPTDPRHTAEHLARTRLLRAGSPCSPCHRERCPLAGDLRWRCFAELDPRAVAAAVSAAWDALPGNGGAPRADAPAR